MLKLSQQFKKLIQLNENLTIFFLQMFYHNMKIIGCCNNYNSPAFCAKKHTVQKADDIQREARRTFPMLSPTYVDAFYHVDKYSASNRAKAERITEKLQSKITDARDMESYPNYYKIEQSDFEKETPYSLILGLIKDLKLGNCKENAKAAVAVLCANGYLNTQRAELKLAIDIVNKKTGEVEYSEQDSLDHSFAITDMNTEDDLDIVVDPWLGFADTKDRAIAKFKTIYDERDFYDAKSFCRYRFFLKKANSGEEFNADDYETKTRMLIVPIESFKQEQMRNLGHFTKLMNSKIKPSD